jgi:predicted MFS family arabinose efflux permease
MPFLGKWQQCEAKTHGVLACDAIKAIYGPCYSRLDSSGLKYVWFFRPGKGIARVLVVLGIAQIIGWGTVGLLAVIGRQVAADLHMSVAAAFAGVSVFYVVMGLYAPALAKPFTAFGARRVMICGTALAAPGFVLLAVSQGPVLYFAAWLILGMAGSATLSTAAYILLNEIAGSEAKSSIGALMLMTGLSSSIFWPITAFLSEGLGWRATSLIFAGAMVLVCLPLYAFGLPRREVRAGEVTPSTAPAAEIDPVVRKSTFYLIVGAIALNAFVTFGMSAVLIELLKAEGLPPAEAIAFASALGVIQVSARGIDFVGGGRWDGITTGLVAGLALPVAMLLFMTGGGARWAAGAFILLYGLGSGALAVARATIPLTFYDKAAFARASSQIALPINLLSALSPPLLMGTLTHFGSGVLLGLTALCSCAALLVMLLLSRRRPRAAVMMLA